MYKNKALKRSYVFAYIMTVLGATIPGLLFVKVNNALGIVFFILAFAVLAGLIVSHVYYSKDKKIYFIVGASSIGAFDVLTILGLILESVYTGQGKSAPYAWIMISLSLVSAILVSTFFLLDHFKKED